MFLNLLKYGSRGPDVASWQTFLIGEGFDLISNGIYGKETFDATTSFQERNSIDPSGSVDRETIISAMQKGYGIVEDVPTKLVMTEFEIDSAPGVAFSYNEEVIDKSSPMWPIRPVGCDPLPLFEKSKMFGTFSYVSSPIPGCPEFVHVKDPKNFELVKVNVPELSGIKGAPKDCNVLFNKNAALGLKNLFEEWSKAGLLGKILTWDGAYVPRFVRGSRTVLSNHAWGTAFDINAKWNALGTQGPKLGREGCLRELIEVASIHGFFNGLWIKERPDPMHFEAINSWGFEEKSSAVRIVDSDILSKSKMTTVIDPTSGSAT